MSATEVVVRIGAHLVGRDLADHGHLLIRRAVRRNDWISDAIFDLAANGQAEWSPQEWAVTLRKLDKSSETIADWLILNS